MPKVIVVPAIDVMGGSVVRLRRGDPSQRTDYGDDPSAFALRWESEGADMIHIVDLDATLGRGSNTAAIARLAAESRVPVEVAGGLRDVEAAMGAAGERNRIVLGTMALADRDSLLWLRDRLGAARVVVSLDHRAGAVLVRGWTAGAGATVAEAMDSLVADGITGFMVTAVDRDGMMAGPELDILAAACSRPARVIASGGIASAADVAAVRERGAHGVILGRAIYDGRLGVREARGAACP
ncbi:MAG: 1-(5-phosphoribosyl)-5-[(5-phosphoribosylamino)methylideneamino] imidazole-4-carboxamide isomerase [Thaumarchaeota archaeon]|nr:1-(5-phosphoribosyl)-5-[(5-phosphoribosylamino)methylideneamino] imidazole-4-carboxamide isomerase [Nitrososphaerota archaeon]